MKFKKITFVAIAATASLALSACGASYQALGTEMQASARGTVDLTTYNGSIFFGNPVPRTDAGSTTAKVKANISYSGGNWNINGEWQDGIVSFKFQGVSPYIAVAYCGLISSCSPINPGPAAPFAAKMRTQVKGLAANTSNGHHDNNGWVNGGCLPMLAYYKSTNVDHPGVGQVALAICDSANGGGTFGWTNPDYIAVSILDTNSFGDASPYTYYTSGGYFSGRESGTQVAIRQTFQSPTATPSPLWPSPVPQ